MAQPVRSNTHRGGSLARRLPKTLTRDEVDLLMAQPNLRAPTGLRDRAMMALMHRCGLRVSETCAVHLRDVKWKDNQIHMRPEVAKGGREAVAYLDADVQDWLERWVQVRRQYAARKPHLFTTLKGGAVSRQSVWEMVRRRAQKAGIDRDVHPHMLRHTYATELLREGFNLREVQALLRHSNIATTSLYLHVVDVELHRKVLDRQR